MTFDRLRIEDYSDREFLLIVADTADADGWTEAQTIAAQMDLRDKRIASSRLSWLRRYGAVEREHKRDELGRLSYHRDGRVRHTQRWRLTEAGRAIAFGRLRKGDESALARLKDDQLLLVTRWLTQRTSDDGTVGRLVAREWRYGHARR